MFRVVHRSSISSIASIALRFPCCSTSARFQRFRMLHHLMVGTWTPPGAIFTFEFDDESLSLRLIKRTEIPQDEPISWMTFDVSSIPFSSQNRAGQLTSREQHAKKNIYGAAMKKWSSFAVKSPTEIVYEASHPMEHDGT